MPIRPFKSARLMVASAAVPLLVLAIAMPGTASAGAKPKPVKGDCTSLSGNYSTNTPPPTLNGCSPSPEAVGPATFTFPAATSGTSTIHWPNGSTTSFTFSSKVILATATKKGKTEVNSKDHCPGASSGTFEVELKGKISANTNLPSGDTGLKGSAKADVCVATSGDISLVPGSEFAL